MTTKYSSLSTEGRSRLLDLFCGAGGAAMGYHRAGFGQIVGVDIKPEGTVSQLKLLIAMTVGVKVGELDELSALGGNAVVMVLLWLDLASGDDILGLWE